MSIAELVTDGPLLLAMPVAAAAGVLSFFSPCVLPLVPGYLSYVTGLSGADLAGEEPAPAAERPRAGEPAPAEEPVLVAAGATVSAAAVAAAAGTASVSASSSTTVSASVAAAPAVAGGGPADGAARGRMAGVARSAAARVRRAGRVTLGTVLFVLGFTAVFVSFGAAFGGLGQWLQVHQTDLAKVLGAITIVMGLLFAGAFARLPLANREIRFLHRLPARGGLLGAPLLGVLFGLGWTPCIGPTLSAVLGLAVQSATAGRGALLSAVYCLGLGIPFIAVGLAFRRLAGALRAGRAHARLLSIAGGVLLVAVGIAQVTGEWTELVDTLRRYTPGFAEAPL